ncbi:ThuA domain-containing protein [Streptacidiphilus sp. N1-12]|uniref:ThuA domain-containing protein n=2 Tax=Streptacidiphilus alkalitolerans TaxID=3342712 RepID=A0ABV6V7E2_9ACTN
MRGGWEGHAPVRCTEIFLPALTGAGFAVTVSEDLDVYRDRELLAGTDLIVQCWSIGTLTPEQSEGLVAAVHAGTGFAGWHGGLVGTFTDSTDYLRMVGGLFLHHPDEHISYGVRIEPEQADHPVVAGLSDFTVHTEQYWMLTDAHNTTLASTVIEPGRSGQGEAAVRMPVVWTREWGRGRVFFSAIGHSPSDLLTPTVRTLTTRGLLWAAR